MAEVENQQVKTKREAMLERLKGRNPDIDLADDEAVYGAISDDYDNYDSELNSYKEREKAIIDMFDADPRSASFFSSWRNGDDPVMVLIRQFGTDIKDIIDDPVRQEQIAAANEDFVKRVAKEKELDDLYQQNISQSLQTIDELQEKNNLTDEQVDEAMTLILKIVYDAIIGKFTPETIDIAMKAINHDLDVANAEHVGEVRGKNAKIDERLRKMGKGDGISALGGKNGGGGSPRRQRNMGALDNFGEGAQTIWERGGEKRTVRNG